MWRRESLAHLDMHRACSKRVVLATHRLSECQCAGRGRGEYCLLGRRRESCSVCYIGTLGPGLRYRPLGVPTCDRIGRRQEHSCTVLQIPHQVHKRILQCTTIGCCKQLASHRVHTRPAQTLGEDTHSRLCSYNPSKRDHLLGL